MTTTKYFAMMLAFLLVISILSSFIAPGFGAFSDMQRSTDYLIKVLLIDNDMREFYYSISLSSLENNIEVARNTYNDCINNYEYQTCLFEQAKLYYIYSVYDNRKGDTGQQIVDYVSQVTTAYDMCVEDGYSCSYLRFLQNKVIEWAEPEYHDDLFCCAIDIDGKYYSSYTVTWTKPNTNDRENVWVDVNYEKSNDDEERSLVPSMPVRAFSINEIQIEDLEREVFNLVNEFREENDLKSLDNDEDLASIARAHSEEQVAYRYLSHYNNVDEGPTERGENANYECIKEIGDYRYKGLAENTEYSFIYKWYTEDGNVGDEDWMTETEIAKDIFEGWESSPGHRDNMLNETYTSAGMGIAINEKAEIVATQDFC